MERPVRRRRGELRPAPVPSGFGGIPVMASGAGAVTTYRARTVISEAPERSIPLVGSETPAREVNRALPSVTRRSRAAALVSLAAVACSCVVTVVGLVFVVKAAFGI